MVNQNCKYRRICEHAEGCYERTRDEEKWCPYAKALTDEDKELELKYWREILAPKGGLVGKVAK